MHDDAISLPKIYCRVTLDGKAPKYELMSEQMKIKEYAFTDLADLVVFMADLLTEKQAKYEVHVNWRKFDLTWPELHSCMEQIAGALRFESVTV